MASEARELKVDGAFAAAQDPESQITADDAQREMVEESRNAGVAAYSFDPDASPEEKRAQAQAVSCKPPLHSRTKCTARAIHSSEANSSSPVLDRLFPSNFGKGAPKDLSPSRPT